MVDSVVMIGFIGAMGCEIQQLKEQVNDFQAHRITPMLEVYTGKLEGKAVCFTNSGVGQTAAASATALMLSRFPVVCIVFTGVAGGLLQGQQVGDFVLASVVIDCDFNLKSLLGPDWQRPTFQADGHLLALAKAAVPSAVIGRVATISTFLNVQQKQEMAPLWEEVAGDDAVVAHEMEMAAVAAVSEQFGCPFLGVRALSDVMEGDSKHDFATFMSSAAQATWPIIIHIVRSLDLTFPIPVLSESVRVVKVAGAGEESANGIYRVNPLRADCWEHAGNRRFKISKNGSGSWQIEGPASKFGGATLRPHR